MYKQLSNRTETGNRRLLKRHTAAVVVRAPVHGRVDDDALRVANVLHVLPVEVTGDLGRHDVAKFAVGPEQRVRAPVDRQA